MRTDVKVGLGIDTPPKVLNKTTGNYEVGSAVIDSMYANVNDMKAEMQKLLFGEIGTKAKTVRFLQKPQVEFDYMVIDDVEYDVEDFQEYRNKASYFVRERL